MSFIIFFMFFALSLVDCKNYVKSLTESMGQEVIEISSPIKGLDEEPSAEFEEDKTSVLSTTRREGRKTSTVLSSTSAQKLATVNNNLSQEDEEKRIEKELSEIYKDNDYKSDITKPTTNLPISTKAEEDTKPIGRQGKKTNFKFQPDLNDRADVERFRTSVDDITCEKRVTQRLHEVQETTSASSRVLRNTIAVGLAFVSVLVCQ